MGERSRMCTCFKQTRPSPNPVQAVSSLFYSVQEKEFSGICRLLNESNPATQPKSLTLALEVLKLVSRSGLKAKLQKTITESSHVFDQALACSLAGARKRLVQDEKWYAVWKPAISVVVDIAACDRIFEASKWDSVSQDVARLTSLTSLGKALFGWAVVYCVADKLQCSAEEHLKALLAKAKIGPKEIEAWWDAVNKDAHDNDAFTCLNTKRQAKLSYRGRSVEITVHSWQHQLEIMLGCSLKSCLVGQALPEVTIEAGLIEHVPSTDLEVHPDVLLSYGNARLLANEMIAGQPQAGRVLIDLLCRELQACIMSPNQPPFAVFANK